MTAWWTMMVGALALAVTASSSAGSVPEPRLSSRCAVYVPEAARRSGLPEEVVMRVMLAESGGNARIVSGKGAIGCMQIIPATWAYLTKRYNLGADPFDARMNMIGGAMYLAELAARYGWPGALSAYNAGPGRYERYAQGGVPLPAETIAYTARLGGNGAAGSTATAEPRWQEAGLFITRPRFQSTAGLPATPTISDGSAEVRPRNSLFPLSGSSDGRSALSAAP